MENEEIRKLVCEPVTRSDGSIIRIYKTKLGSYDFSFGGLGQSYTKEEVVLLGKGNETRGMLLIGRTLFDAPSEALKWGGRRILNEEIKVLTDIQCDNEV